MEHLRLRINELEKYVNVVIEKIHDIAEKVDKHEDIIVEVVEEINKLSDD